MADRPEQSAAMRHRNCTECASSFSYPISRGMDRLICSPGCRAARVTRLRLSNPPTAICAVPDCTATIRSGRATLCEMHYGRMRRRGNLEKRQARPERAHSGGYVLRHSPGHGLADRRGYVYAHRAVLWDATGGEPQECHVCGKRLGWGELHVDHLNDCKTDNRRENLAAACPTCNRGRAFHKSAKTIIDRYAAKITFDGQTLTLSEWAVRTAMPRFRLASRLAAGWSVERALTEGRGKTGPRQREVRP